MITIKRTRERRHPLMLRSEHEDRGPYYLVDRAGYGVSFKGTNPRAFAKALIAFELVNFDESVTPKEAKAAVDKVSKYTYKTEAHRFWDALSMIEKSRAKAAKR